MTDYFLAPHVYFGCRGDALIFLDLRQDDYLLVNGSTAMALQAMISEDQSRTLTPESVGALEELLEGGLLTKDRNTGKNIVATKVELALEHLLSTEHSPVDVTPSHVWHFAMACVTAAIRLAWQRFESVVSAVRHKKLRRSSPQPINLVRARELVSVFRKLRCFFPRGYLCLYDSLALLEFLACYQIFPTWVFGVKLEPWAAHCWVQEAGLVFDEDVEIAAKYTPVLAV